MQNWHLQIRSQNAQKSLSQKIISWGAVAGRSWSYMIKRKKINMHMEFIYFDFKLKWYLIRLSLITRSCESNWILSSWRTSFCCIANSKSFSGSKFVRSYQGSCESNNSHESRRGVCFIFPLCFFSLHLLCLCDFRSSIFSLAVFI